MTYAKTIFAAAVIALGGGTASAQTQTFSAEEICKAAIGGIMGRDVKTISAKKVKDEIVVDYTRPSDGQKFRYKCVLPGDRVIWAGWIDGKWGRWRDRPNDDQLSYKEEGSVLVISESYPGSSSAPVVKTFKKSDF